MQRFFNLLAARLAGRKLLQNTIWVLTAQGTRLILQAIYFVVIARRLGVSEYGAFASAVALIGIAAPFAGIGSGNLLVKNVARRREVLPEYFGNALFITLLSGLLWTAIILLAARLMLPTVPLVIIIMVALSDLLFSRWLEITGQAFQALEELKETAHIYVVQSVARLAGALLLLVLPSRGSAAVWSVLYLASTTAATLYAFWLVRNRVASIRTALGRIRGELVEGFQFSVSLSAQSIYNNIDKTLLARMTTVAVAGFYAAAYRIVELSFLPVSSLLMASYASFFQQGERGLGATVRHAATLLPRALAYSATVAALLFVSAPLLPYILGHGFQESVTVMRWLAVLPVMKAFSYFAGDSLTGAGHQGLRSAVQVGVAVGNAALTIAWIHFFGWMGAVWASLVSDGALALALWVVVAALLQKQSKAATVTACL
jgi:O-antigen/teichoic acid export membrane protein